MSEETKATRVIKGYITSQGKFVRKDDGLSFGGILSRASDDPGYEVDFHEPPYEPQSLVNLAVINITHARCALTKAADSAGIGYRIVAPNDDKDAPPKETVKRVEDFIVSANPDMPFLDVLNQFTFARETVGWGTLEVVRTKDKTQIARLEPVAAQTIRVTKKTEGVIAEFVQVAEADQERIYFQKFPRPDGQFVERSTGKAMSGYVAGRSANEMIFWKKPYATVTRHYGVPDIIPAVEDILCSREIRSYFLKFFENSCIPEYLVIIKGGDVTLDLQKKIEKFFRSEYKGEPHKTLLLSSDGDEFEVRLERIGEAQKEADYRETRKDLRDFIRMAHGMPPVILGIVDTESRGSASGLSQAEIYLNRIVKPIQSGLHFYLDKLLKDGLGITDAVIRLEAPDVRNLEIEMRRDTNYVSHGILSINEVRSKYGYASIDGGDTHRIWSRRTSPKNVGMDEGDNTMPAPQPEG